MKRVLAPIVAAIFFAGCAYTPGGPMRSNDQFTYESTVYDPVNVSIVDSRNGEVVWYMEVPVGNKVTVRFYPNQGDGYEDYPDILKWQVQGKGDFNGRLQSTIPVPDRWSRRIDVTYRASPEYYPGAEPLTAAD